MRSDRSCRHWRPPPASRRHHGPDRIAGALARDRRATPPSQRARRRYRGGMLGRPIAVNPLAARSQADRNLVALVFSGLVARGPDGTLIPGLAANGRLTRRAELDVHAPPGRPLARRHPGHRQRRRLHDQRPPQSRVHGPGRRVRGAGRGDGRRRAHGPDRPGHAARRFLELATQPDRADPPPRNDPGGRTRGRSVQSGAGRFGAVRPHGARRRPRGARAGRGGQLGDPGAEPSPAAIPSDPLGTVTPTTARPPRAELGRMEFRFFDEPADLEAFQERASWTQRRACGRRRGRPRSAQITQLLRYRGTTLTTVLLNLRPSHPELRDPAVGSRCQGDRPAGDRRRRLRGACRRRRSRQSRRPRGHSTRRRRRPSPPMSRPPRPR